MAAEVTTEGLLTASQLAELHEELFQFELDQGELIIMAPAGEEHGRHEGRLFGLLFAQIEARDLGVLYTSDTGFILARDPDVVRSPDIAFVSKERFPLAVDPSGYIIGAPDLAIEVQSPSQSPADLEKKVSQYLASGTREVWVLHPRKRGAARHQSSGSVVDLGSDDLLQSPDILPGVHIRLSSVFVPPTRGA